MVGCCRSCGCTKDNPCILANGDECAFLTSRADRCNNPNCVKAWEKEYDRLLEADRRRQAIYRKARSQRKPARRRRAA